MRRCGNLLPIGFWRKGFGRRATIWNWCCMSVNLVSRHPQNPRPSLSEFLIQFGLPGDFLGELQNALWKPFDQQLGVTEMLVARHDDGWRPICHVEGKRAWKFEDSPDDWVPITKAGILKRTTSAKKREKARDRIT